MSSDAEDETPRFFRCEGSQDSDESAPRRALQIMRVPMRNSAQAKKLK